MMFLSLGMIFTLMLMSLVHVYWAFGGVLGLDKVLPTQEGKRLLNPSKALTFGVAIVLMSFAYVVYAYGFKDYAFMSKEQLHYALIIMIVIFALRSLGDFNMLGIFKKIKNTEFAHYDNTLFIPLCVGFSVGLSLLL